MSAVDPTGRTEHAHRDTYPEISPPMTRDQESLLHRVTREVFGEGQHLGLRAEVIAMRALLSSVASKQNLHTVLLAIGAGSLLFMAFLMWIRQ